MQTKYLITGGAGNLATQLTYELGVPGEQIVLFDLADQPAHPILPSCRFVQGDVTSSSEIRELFETMRPDTVLHMASLLSGSSEQNRQRAWDINVHSTLTLLEVMLEVGIERIFFPSTVATYGGVLPDVLGEDHPQWPATFYGATKVACERLGVYFHERHGLDFRCVRLPIVLSPHAPPGAASAYASRAFVEAVQLGRYTFRVAPVSRASSMYVRDALRAIVGLVQASPSRLTRRTYNVHALAPTAEQIAAAIAVRVPAADLAFDPDPSMVDLVASWPSDIDDQAAKGDWDWQPQYDLNRLADDFVGELERQKT